MKRSAFCFATTTSSRGGKKMWCVPKLDDEYIHKMEDVLEVYERPLDPQQPVVCLDERAVQLHGEKRQASPAMPGKPARFDYEYVRQGTANIFCVVEPAGGQAHHQGDPQPQRGPIRQDPDAHRAPLPRRADHSPGDGQSQLAHGQVPDQALR